MCQVKTGKLPVMSMNYSDVSNKSMRVAAHLFFMFSAVFLAVPLATDSGARKNQRMVVLDPGHGGSDLGVTGPSGLSEKTVAIRLSRLIASEFAGNCSVMLTRTDDSGLDIQARTSRANHCKADIFIGIHTGGGMAGDPHTIMIYHSKEMRHPSREAPVTVANGLSPWIQIQNGNIRSSVMLAEKIRKRIEHGGKLGEVEIRRAPIPLLEGADMPAILIEIGQLTNPLMENKLKSDAFLTILAKAIRSGITDWLAMPD